MYCIETEQLYYKKGAKVLLNNINIQIKKGEYWILLGNNGCGKTTLASVLSGYQPYSAGKIKIFGKELNDITAIDIRKKIGFVSSSYFDKCLRYENGINIVLGAKNGALADGLSITDEDIVKAKKILEQFGLKYKGLYPYDLLSKGQQQKILLARSFMTKPELLILDEPCTGLDIISRGFLLNTLQDIASLKMGSILYITHHTDEILPFFTHALLMKNGEIYSQGKIEEVFTEYNLSEFFETRIEIYKQNEKISFKIKNDICLNKECWLG